MRKIVALAAAATAFAATPAVANEGRVEARAGVVWGALDKAVTGVAAGYDFNLGPVFAGPEIAADKVLADGTRVSVSVGGRVGAGLPGFGKLYALGAYQTKFCASCENGLAWGAGYERGLLPKIYGKIEYRHVMFDSGVKDANAVVAGVGVRF